MIEKPLDEYLDPNILDRSPFFQFKSQLVSYYQATKVYHESLIKGCEDFGLNWDDLWATAGFFWHTGSETDRAF